jgi:DNA-binding response OmpR family regulator/DNA-binding CsgD family transcriptional regulator
MKTPEPKPIAAAEPAVNERVVLVVDDALETLRMLCDALDAEGYTVLVARDAVEALQRFEITVPDAVLLDAVMPGIDGFALCRQLKAAPAWSHVPVIFMTGLSETAEIVQGFDSGGVDYVVKPLRVPEVLARLATHVRNARSARLAREAVDVAGMGVVVLDNQGRVAWRSPQAKAWLELDSASDTTAGNTMDARAPSAADRNDADARWLASAVPGEEIGRSLEDGRRLVVRHLGEGGLGETMLLLSLGAATAARRPTVALTRREAEVLSWLAKGKTNRDIADIIGMSPRTVNKHLEHIFEKLGVETRTAAAAVAASMGPENL